MEVDKDGPFVKMGSGYSLRFEDDETFEETYQERAKNELGETPERRAEALEELRRLIRGKRNLPNPPITIFPTNNTTCNVENDDFPERLTK